MVVCIRLCSIMLCCAVLLMTCDAARGMNEAYGMLIISVYAAAPFHLGFALLRCAAMCPAVMCCAASVSCLRRAVSDFCQIVVELVCCSQPSGRSFAYAGAVIVIVIVVFNIVVNSTSFCIVAF